MTMTLQASSPPDIAPLPSLDSGLAGLALIAGYYRIAAEPMQLRHQLALSGRIAGAEDEGSDAFNFLSPFGQDTITNFQAAGSGHGVVTFDQSLFANWSAIDASLANTNAGAEITLNSNETITFTGVTKSMLEANHAADFRIV